MGYDRSPTRFSQCTLLVASNKPGNAAVKKENGSPKPYAVMGRERADQSAADQRLRQRAPAPMGQADQVSEREEAERRRGEEVGPDIVQVFTEGDHESRTQ